MSGICGIIRFNNEVVRKEEIQMMLNTMKNRGSDNEGIWVDSNVGFGHKMLWTTPESIYETQPHLSEDKNITIVADARIDNRDELMEKLNINREAVGIITDIDLILLSYINWGEECPKFILGDFVFCIFDRKKKKLFLAKDHIGIRPLFYYHDKNIFCFASEISVLFSLSSIKKRINYNALNIFKEYMDLGYEDTFFKDIKRVPPAHKIILDKYDIKFSRYWFPEQLKINTKISFTEASQKFREILQEAIDVRLRSAYPIGCELSGGLDSSSVFCLAVNGSRKKNIVPFSHRYGKLDCDESYYSDLVANSLGVNIHTVRVDKLDYDSEYSLDQYFKYFPDWPTYLHFIGALPIAKKAKQQNIRILLTGQGGDHLLEGNLYILIDYLKAFKFIKLYKELSYYNWSKKIIKRYIIKPILSKHILKLKDFLTSKKSHKVTSPNNFFESADNHIKISSFALKHDINSIIGTFTAFWADSNVYHNIEKFNIESRHPYFDVRLVEFCLSLPEEYKIQYGVSKKILKKAMKGILPEPVRSRNDKAGFNKLIEIQLAAEYANESKINFKQSIIQENILKQTILWGIFKWKKRNFKDR